MSYLIENSPKLFNQRLEKGAQVRQKQKKWIKGSLLIDDTYNANPESVKKAIDFISNSNKRKVFIMGDMLELGRYRKKMHADVGQYARIKKVDVFLGFGELTKYAVSGYGNNGLFFNNENDLKKVYKQLVKKFHPDVKNNIKNKEKIIKKINNAYKLLFNLLKNNKCK